MPNALRDLEIRGASWHRDQKRFAFYELALEGASLSAPTAAPRLVYFHGRGGRAESLGYPFTVGIPLRAVVPQANLRLQGADGSDGFAWSPYSVTSKRPLELAATLLGTAHEVAAFLEEIRQGPDERFVVSGFSQGAMLALLLGLYHPDLVHGVIVAAAHLPESLEPLRRLPDAARIAIRCFQGDQDPIVPCESMCASSKRLAALGYNIETQVFTHNEHTMSDAMSKAFAAAFNELLANTT